MGYIRHETVVVTTDRDKINEVLTKAKELHCLVSEVVDGAANGTSSIFVAPDGSKEGWDTSETHQSNRNAFVTYLKSFAYGVHFIQVQFGGDDASSVTIVEHDQKGQD